MGIEFNSWKDKVYDIPLENEQPSAQYLNQVQHLLQQGKELEQQVSDPLVKREITYLNKELSSADKRMRLATTPDPQQKKAIEREIQADEFETAVTDIMSTMGICEEGLSTEEQTYLKETFQAYALMGDRLEDATELLGRKLFPPIIEKGQWQALSIEEQQKIKRLVIDTLLMASFQPTRTDTGHSSFSHINCTAPPFEKLSQLKPLQIVEADTLLGYLASSINRGEREASSLFSTLLGSDYQQGSISQKVLLMIAAKQKSMTNNPLIQKLYTSPFLDELLFQNMFMTEQQYMNSCVCATVNQALFMQNSTLPSLIHITERLIEAAQNRLEEMPEEKKQQKIFQSALGFGGTTVEAHYEKEISEAKEQLEEMEKTFMALIDQLQVAHMKTPSEELEYDYSAYYQLEQTKNAIFSEMQTLTEQINDRMQRLLTLQSDNTPAYLSYKPISGQWGMSAAVMLIPGTVMGIVGAYPSPLQRLQPAMSRESFEAVNDLLKQHSSLHLPPVHSSKRLLDAAKEAKEQKLTTEMTTKLWDDIYSLGAVRLTQQFHSLMISAISIDGQKLFVVCDPKGRNFDLYDHKSIGSLLKTQA